MKTPNPPFYNTNDELLYALLTGGNAIGYEQLAVNDLIVASLSPPPNTLYALVVVEADPTATDKTRVARFMEARNFISPGSEVGIPLGDLSVYEVKGKQNLENWRIIGIEAGKIHQLRIQYFG